jgi:hypothetical protein
MPLKSNVTDAVEIAARQMRWANRALLAWVIVVSLVFLWQALEYRGLVAWLAELQFLQWDRYWPTLTFVALTTLFSTPMLLFVGLMRADQRRNDKLRAAQLDDERQLLGRTERLYEFFLAVALGSLAAVALCLFLMFRLPGERGPVRSVVMGSPDAIAPIDGRSTITGAVNLAETSQFNENLLLVKRTLYFAPVLSGNNPKEPLRYFVEVRREDVPPGYNRIAFPEEKDDVHVYRFRVPEVAFSPYMNGMLKRNALPGEIVHLYRYAGYKVAPDNFVLFRSADQLRWRYYMLAGQFAISAIIAGLFAIYVRRRRRKLRDTVVGEFLETRQVA